MESEENYRLAALHDRIMDRWRVRSPIETRIVSGRTGKVKEDPGSRSDFRRGRADSGREAEFAGR